MIRLVQGPCSPSSGLKMLKVTITFHKKPPSSTGLAKHILHSTWLRLWPWKELLVRFRRRGAEKRENKQKILAKKDSMSWKMQTQTPSTVASKGPKWGAKNQRHVRCWTALQTCTLGVPNQFCEKNWSFRWSYEPKRTIHLQLENKSELKPKNLKTETLETFP